MWKKTKRYLFWHKRLVFWKTQTQHKNKRRKKTFFALKILFKQISGKWYIYEKESEFPLSKKFVEEVIKTIGIKFEVKEQNEKDFIEKQLKSVGINKIIEINKTRKLFKIQDIDVCLDEVEKLGKFIEIEGTDNPYLIIEEIGITNFTEIRNGYTEEILRKKYPNIIPDEKVIHNFYLSNPGWNVLENEKEIYLKINSVKNYYIGISGINIDINVLQMLDELLKKKDKIKKLFIIYSDNIVFSSEFTKLIYNDMPAKQIVQYNIELLEKFLTKNNFSSWEIYKMSELIPKILEDHEQTEIVNKLLSTMDLTNLSSKTDLKEYDIQKIICLIYDYILFYNSEKFFNETIETYFTSKRHKPIRVYLNKQFKEKSHQETIYFELFEAPKTIGNIRLNYEMPQKEIKRILHDWAKKKGDENSKLVNWLESKNDVDEIYEKIKQKYYDLIGIKIN